MKIQILGKGCINCKKLEENVRIALKQIGLNEEVEKVTDVNKIVEMGVLMTPALVIDGKIESTGKVLSQKQIIEIINNRKI
ncbi:MAG: TM0996/MTH895 family glutaredoxin-like protein [Spirochaetes bacterium]|nr:TM0996/MTH895 family glutaredoxin-like protein [Spirochaetota bacterium]MBP8991233.1 TM0996/MTH895 family glutaredoxin-like protein [Spirochaetota bacterium]